MSKSGIRAVKSPKNTDIKNTASPTINKYSKMLFSFESLERNEYFNLDSTCGNWSSDLFAVLKSVSGLTALELRNTHDGTFRFHNHAKAKPPCPLPDKVNNLDEFYQIRIGTSKGGIHGVLVENIFYVLWLDPLHNMYPDSRYGGLRKVKPATTCCMERDERIDELQEQVKDLEEKLEQANKDLEEALEG